MKWKYSLCLLALAALGFFGMVRYYNFGWGDLASLSFYENLANPEVRIVKVQEGLRKEEIADVMQKKLGWTDEDKEVFINAHLALNTENLEGRYFPKSYMLHTTDDDPITVSKIMLNAFNRETSAIPKLKSTKIINEDTALKIASIIQREAGGKSDMKLISGIIWNRIFAGMKLQMDATLQYAKASNNPDVLSTWWPGVESKDKYIESPYNTYKYKDLPPSPIANPGLAAIEAAYNPQKTSCLFYIHDRNRKIHCAKTYEEHMRNIEKYY